MSLSITISNCYHKIGFDTIIHCAMNHQMPFLSQYKLGDLHKLSNNAILLHSSVLADKTSLPDGSVYPTGLYLPYRIQMHDFHGIHSWSGQV